MTNSTAEKILSNLSQIESLHAVIVNADEEQRAELIAALVESDGSRAAYTALARSWLRPWISAASTAAHACIAVTLMDARA